jgi:drug/metabolite transporter (DMT)-like permease
VSDTNEGSHPAETSSSRSGKRAPSLLPHHLLLGSFTFVWGANFVLAEVALAELSPIAFSVARFAVAAAVLTVFFGRRVSDEGGGTLRVARADLPRLFFAALLGGALGPWLGIEGLAHTHAGRASLFVAISPAVSAALGLLLGTEKLDRLAALGLAVTVAGALILAGDGLAATEPLWVGDAMLLGGVLAPVAEFHLLRPLVTAYGANRIVVLRTLIGVLIYLALASPVLGHQPWGSLTLMTWFAIVAGGAIGVGLGQWAKTRALGALGPTRVVVYGNLVPVATMLLAVVFRGTTPRSGEWVAGALVIAGAIVLQRRRA